MDGAIKNVAFEIRQSWKQIPGWLSGVINAGAEQKGGREMTVVGRAAISRWVVDEILEKFFHPALAPDLSVELKEMEHNIRRNAPPVQSIEDDEAISVKVCNWRLTTLDALQTQISGPEALEARSQLAELLVQRLVSSLQHHLNDPTPPGLFGGVQMIVDIAVGLSANLPLESRDVRVWYPVPGVQFDAKYMKGETGLPPLGTPSSTVSNQNSDVEKLEQHNAADKPGGIDDPKHHHHQDDNNPSQRAGVAGLPPQNGGNHGSAKDQKRGMGISGRVKKALQGSSQQQSQQQQAPPPSPGLAPPGSSGGGKSQNSTGQLGQQEQKGEPDKVRVAGFMAVEVRGRSILVKAPIWL